MGAILSHVEAGLLFLAAVWVLGASVWRLNLLHWGRHDALQILAYIALALWAASFVLNLQELRPFGIVGVAVLFLAGRKRWLTGAPKDVCRSGSDAEAQCKAALQASMAINGDRTKDRA